MRITIHQPDFLPWYGFFYRWAQSDLLILYDDAQFIKGGWQNRDKLLINGREQWLTVPVVTKGKLGQLINEVKINQTVKWKHKHLYTFKSVFGKTPNFLTVFPLIEDVYAGKYDNLIDLNISLLLLCADLLKIKTKFRLSSEYGFSSNQSEKLIDLLNAENADEYLSGTGSINYIDEKLFEQNNIKLIYQDNKAMINEMYNAENLYYSIIQCLFQNPL